jgi:hypothetical protein
MAEQSPLPYRLTMYASLFAGMLLSFYGNWTSGAVLLGIAMVMQWHRRLPPKFEWSRWTGLIAGVLMILLDIYCMFDPQVDSLLGN